MDFCHSKHNCQLLMANTALQPCQRNIKNAQANTCNVTLSNLESCSGSLLRPWTVAYTWSKTGNNSSGYFWAIFTIRQAACIRTFFTTLLRLSLAWPGWLNTNAAKILSSTRGRRLAEISVVVMLRNTNNAETHDRSVESNKGSDGS